MTGVPTDTEGKALPGAEAEAGRRPWPAPARPWAMLQTWHDLLFAHWPVDPAQLCASIPAPLRLDTFEGQAWVGVVPFRMSGIQLRQVPLAVPWLSAFPELNVRTYVTAPGGEKPGVYFYSLDAANPIAVAIARRWYGLPYFHARMSCRRAGDWVSYTSHRTHPGAPMADVVGQYRSIGPVLRVGPRSLEAWLTARYCLYVADARGRVRRGDIDHDPWPLQPAEAELSLGNLVAQHGIHLLDTAPALHVARRLAVRAWTPTPLG